MRRSLAPHAHVPSVLLGTPETTALQLRDAERNARAWHRLALVLGACALLALAV
jgi:hypothetical protein